MKRLIIAIAILLVGIAATGFWWTNGLLPANAKNKTPVIFVVKKGEGVREIANRLKSEKLIRDPIVFFLFTRMQGLDKQIQAGDFRINASLTTQEIANNLTHGTLDIWVTIPEGQRALEIAKALKEKLPEYKVSWDEELVKNEGYLFPDTYLIPRDADINFIITLLRNTFTNKYSALSTPQNGLTQNQVVVIASMVEREARHDEDRPLIASVILNRLGIGMKLDIDATIQYALGYQPEQKRWWKKDLTSDDLNLNSPYNTYKVAGLPPTPISNPGLASLNAVINPAKTNYLFYMTDSKGINHYAETINQHNENIKKFGL
ncbi:MAG: endolytic transglycosylase MltG [Patescibacteria group bacterium]|nr:endolytic transglycosylase MltG [Patescibacteria group bacterium]